MRLMPDATVGIMTMFMEAEGESLDGKVAVAEVILRRTLRKYQSDGSIAGTCLRSFAFSSWNADSPSRIRAAMLDTESEIGQECVRAWDIAVAGSNLTHGAVHYLNPLTVLVMPEWAVPLLKVAQVGRHHFYLDKLPREVTA
jgi:N-acetylmuramoyl-L-alanine amidase